MTGKRRELAGERKEAPSLGIVEGLLAEPVAREEQAPAATVVNGEGEHPVQPDGQPCAPLLIAVHEHLGIGVARGEAVAALDQLAAQLNVIIDLTVEYDADVAGLVPHWLSATSQ